MNNTQNSNQLKKTAEVKLSYYIFSVKSIFFKFFSCAMCISLIGCNLTKKEIDDNYRSGVVLILNQYYYTLTLPNGGVFYLAGDGEGNVINFEADPDSAINCMVAATGTGFFISKDGKIATNKHVASRTVSNKSAIRATKQVLNSLSQYLERRNDTCEAIKQLCQIEYGRTSDAIEKGRYAQIFSEMDEEIKSNNEIIRQLNYINPDDAIIDYHSTLRIAYNGTFVNSIDDMYPCSLRDTANEDLAIIQLNSKQTPSDKYVFYISEKNLLDHYSFGEYLMRMFGSDKNEELFMIGFNHGIGMAITNEGIQSQCTEGTVSRDEKKVIMYTIPTIPGSSGSPVLNRRGQVVAINFAGINNTQSFNYGVKAKHLYDLMQEN